MMDFIVKHPEEKKPEQPKPEEKKKGITFKKEGFITRLFIVCGALGILMLISITAFLTLQISNRHQWDYNDEFCAINNLGRFSGQNEQGNPICEQEIIPVQVQGQTYYLRCDFGIKAETNLQDINVLNKYHCQTVGQQATTQK